MKHSLSILFGCSLAMVGCVDQTDDDTESLGETDQAVSSTALNGFTCSNTQYCNFDLGTASNRACFLGGIRGAAASGTYGSFSGIWVDSNNHFILTIYPPTGNTPLTVTTVCVNPGAHYSNTHWTPNFGVSQVQIPGTTSATRCFLSQVVAESGGMTHYNDSVKTWKDANGAWWVGGSTQTGYVDANATCFDATDVGDWAWGQGVPGSITGNLNSNSGGGIACGLTEIGGIFTTNSQTDGVFIDYAARAKQWIWTLVNYKHGYATCIQ